jgi:hypothetical protein
MRPAEPSLRLSIRRTGLGALCLLIALASRSASAGCPTGTLETGQYRTETQSTIVVHHVCTPLAQLSPTQIVIDGLEDLAMQLGWSDKDRARLATALNSLDLPLRYASTAGRTVPWSLIVARSGNAQLAREAAAGVGPDLWSAGTQTNYDDCALYALAVATGRPYGLVAALATTLIGEESWRDDASAPSPPTPQAVIENGGLNGGETIFLAQSLGQVSVVTPNEFDRTLQAGQPIMTAVFTSSEPGNKIRHEVVLTKAFEHDGAPWYEMVDSARQGALRPLYVSEPELHSILAENGVVYSPRPGTTPTLLR